MDPSVRSELLPVLRDRRDAIVVDWYQAIAGTGYVPLSAVEVRQKLTDLVEQAINLLVTEPFDRPQAEAIGEHLASLHYRKPEALGRTQEVLARQLLAGLPPDQAAALELHLALLLGAMASGFCRESCRAILSDQEEIREALVAELRSVEKALREAHEELELRVQRRTIDLARANEELLIEITQRRRVEEALAESEEKFRTLAEQSPNMIFINRKGRVVYANRRAEEVMGYRKAEYYAADFDFLTLIAPEYHELLESSLGKHHKGEEIEPYEYALITRDARKIEAIVTTRLIDYEGERAILGIVTDITARKQMEAALRESEARWRSLVENAPDTVLTVDREGRILFVNRPVVSHSAAGAVGKNVVDSAEPKYRDLARQSIERVFRTGEPDYLEAEGPSSSGATAWYATRLGPVKRDGEVVAVMMMTRDITEQKTIEAMKDNLIRDVSHELRTPLAKMQMGLELLMELLAREGIDRERAIRIGEMAHDNTQRLLRTVEGILDLSSLETRGMTYKHKPIQLADLIEEAVLDTQSLVGAKGLALVVRLPKRLPPIEGDGERLLRVVTNLIDNAVKFTDAGRIVISAEVNEHEVEIAVSDSGYGILPENQERIFERFYQEKSRFDGVGVGLAICKAIVEAHHGRIWAESPGRGLGTTIRFTLPVAGV